MSIEALLGETVLVSGSTSEVPVTVFETEGSVVGLFFSAIWCPPSRTFTPVLIEWYKRFKKGPKGDLLNIVFVSSDEDEESYKKYRAKMPWFSVDYKDRERESKLSSKFKVTAIPTLIFIDGKTGKVITKDGRSIVTDDPDGEQFPWKPKPFSEIVADVKFTDWDQKETTWDQLQGNIIGLFFSALRLPSKEFTHKLVATYNKLKEAGKRFEIIYIGLDESKEDWQEYLAYMPWISLPYGDKHKDDLIKSFDVSGIPTLLILDEKGSVITSEGWSYMINDPDGATFPWYVNTLTEYTADEINSIASLIWYVSGSAIGRAKEVLEPVAKEYMSKMTEENMEIKLLFFIAKEGTDVPEHLREFAKLPKRNPLLAIVDVPQQQVHISDRSEITIENARKFAYDYLRKRLTGRRLS